MVRYHGIDLGDAQEDGTEGKKKPLIIAGGVVGVLVVAAGLFILLGSGGGDSEPNVVGQDELAKFIEEHPELRDDSNQSK